MFLEIRCDWLVEGTVVWKEGIRESPQSYKVLEEDYKPIIRGGT